MEEAHPQKRLLLELFPGTGTVGEAFRAYGWDVISLGGNPKAYDDATTIIDTLAVQEISGRRAVGDRRACAQGLEHRRGLGLSHLHGEPLV